jgi:predicted nuclease of restriction endonuclease-like (RecB) superfamily
MNIGIKNDNYRQLVSQISDTFVLGQQKAVIAVNTHLVETYWKIGEYIVKYEQGGNVRAEYGKRLLEQLSQDLSMLHGKGFGISNIYRMRQFRLAFPILAELPQELTWTHCVELLKIENPQERSFYLNQTINENWSTTQLIRQKKASLFLRLAAAKDKEGILQLAQQGQIIEKPEDIIREPYILDFLRIPEAHNLNETEIEERIISQLQHFLLEMGKGFAFVGRQYRIMLGNRAHRIDLVFYHYILKCFVLIDLKRESAGYEDVGQMNMYLGYFEKEESNADDNPPIGIVLAREKDEYVVEYAMHNISSRLFVSKYQLYLPTKEDLKRIIEKNKSNTDDYL